ncbi:hypothetical protein L6452_43792 [Arctium lappa]|uniref:Uncharacterized protein n=1 Tax=Arctium lappa TaxID=4217 RepID=A0ACB8XHW4_ARCLA|nr:hypothetical protein L6452_43792 [Arctium lappa]
MIYDLKESLQPLITFTVISLDLRSWDFKVPVEDGDELRGVGVSFPTVHDDVTLKINPWFLCDWSQHTHFPEAIKYFLGNLESRRCSLSGHDVKIDKVILQEMMCSVETPSG